jgi:hypothetical protein
MIMRALRLRIGFVLAGTLLAVLALIGARSAAAQGTGPADFTQFGYPTVAASVMFTPGTAATLTAGNQTVVLPADFISKTVQFELLTGDPAFFKPLLESDDQARPIVAAWAFRVTDPATGQRVARFDKPVQWSVTDPRIGEGSAVYNTSAANPPVVTDNSVPGTVTGTTLAHSFGGAGVGWLALGTEQAVIAPAPGMPVTGSPWPAAGLVGFAFLVALLCAGAGFAVRRQGARS